MATTFQGTQTLPFPTEQVWDALFDVDVLRASIAGCELLEQRGENDYAAQVRVSIGPVSASFATTIEVVDPEPPHRCTLRFSGKGGAIGFGKGDARVSLTSRGDAETLLEWSASTQVGGKIAQMGTRLIDGTVRKMSDDFFERFAKQLGDATQAPSPDAAAVTAADTATTSRPRDARARYVWTAIAITAGVGALWLLISIGGGR